MQCVHACGVCVRQKLLFFTYLYHSYYYACSFCSITLKCPIYLSGWVAAKSVRLYVDKNYRYHFLSILGHDPPPNQSLETISGKMRDWDMDHDVDSGAEGEQGKATDETAQLEEGKSTYIANNVMLIDRF